jgi:hypothetical protein
MTTKKRKLPEPRLPPEEKWEELKRHLLESKKWCEEQQENVRADHFYFFLREGFVRDVLGYMMWLDGVRSMDNAMLWSLLGNPPEKKKER